jgi:hypothetical protein
LPQYCSPLHIHDCGSAVANSRDECHHPQFVLRFCRQAHKINGGTGVAVALVFWPPDGRPCVLETFTVVSERIDASAVVVLQGLELHVSYGLERLTRLSLIRRDRFEPNGIGLAEFFVECRTEGIVDDELLGLDDQIVLDLQAQD